MEFMAAPEGFVTECFNRPKLSLNAAKTSVAKIAQDLVERGTCQAQTLNLLDRMGLPGKY